MSKYRQTLKLEYFDLETCPQPTEKLRPLMPEFNAPSGWKDPTKIQAEVEKKQAKWLDDAALSPLTGQILAAVWVDMAGEVTIYDADEVGEYTLLCQLFTRISNCGMGAHYKVAGFNIGDFDIPWLIKRAWALGLGIPTGLVKMGGKWMDLPPWLFDIRHLWGMGEPYAKGQLGAIAAFLGVGEKKGSGKDFHRMWRDPSQHADAYEYLMNDGLVLPRITERLLSLSPDQYGLKIQNQLIKNETRIPREDSSESHPKED